MVKLKPQWPAASTSISLGGLKVKDTNTMLGLYQLTKNFWVIIVPTLVEFSPVSLSPCFFLFFLVCVCVRALCVCAHAHMWLVLQVWITGIRWIMDHANKWQSDPNSLPKPGMYLQMSMQFQVHKGLLGMNAEAYCICCFTYLWGCTQIWALLHQAIQLFPSRKHAINGFVLYQFKKQM